MMPAATTTSTEASSTTPAETTTTPAEAAAAESRRRHLWCGAILLRSLIPLGLALESLNLWCGAILLRRCPELPWRLIRLSPLILEALRGR
jgi:hypothetical protein